MNQPAKDALRELRSLTQWSWSGRASESPESLLSKQTAGGLSICFYRFPRCSEAADLLIEPKAGQDPPGLVADIGEGRGSFLEFRSSGPGSETPLSA